MPIRIRHFGLVERPIAYRSGMGLKDYAARHRFDAAFADCRLGADKIHKGLRSWPVAGAKADFEHGANVGSRVTASRVLMTGIFALALKKNRNKVYVMIELADGEQLLVEGKAKDEKKARTLAQNINRAGEHFAE